MLVKPLKGNLFLCFQFWFCVCVSIFVFVSSLNNELLHCCMSVLFAFSCNKIKRFCCLHRVVSFIFSVFFVFFFHSPPQK